MPITRITKGSPETYNDLDNNFTYVDNLITALKGGDTTNTVASLRTLVDTKLTTAQVNTIVNTAVTALVNSSPDALNTLKELADALGDDPNFATTITTLIGTKVSQTAYNAYLASTNIYTTAEKTRLSALSNFNPIDYGNSSFFEVDNGMYYPVLTAEALSNGSGLSNHINGGIVATTSGTNGTGSIYLPKAIDPSLPFRCAVLVEVNDNIPITDLHFSSSNNDYRTGLKIGQISTINIGGGMAGGVGLANNYGTNGIPAGTKLWFGMVGDGINVYAYIIPDATPTGFKFGGGTSSATYSGVAYSEVKPINAPFPNTTDLVFGGTGLQKKYRLNRLSITTQSTQNRIIGVWWNQGFGGPKDGRLTPPAMFKTTILNDNSAVIIIPKQQGSQPIDLVMLNHPNAFNTTGYLDPAGAGGELAKLYQAGYLIFGIDGGYLAGNSSLDTEATISNWGAPTGMKYRKSFWQWIRTNIPGTRYINELGLSMGFLNSLRIATQYPGQIKSIVGIGGVCNLTDCFDNRGFGPTIRKAFGLWYTALTNSTGVQPDQIVRINGAGSVGATTITVNALTNAVPSGTILTWDSTSASGQTSIITTATASANATSITVTALTTAVTVGASYNMTAHWQQINYDYSQPDDVYYSSPYIWKDLYVTSSTYLVNDIITISASTSTTSSTFKFVDPMANPNNFKNIPMAIWHGDADTLIPIAQPQGFVTAVNGIGGNVVLHTVSGGTHLSLNTFDGSGILAFLNAQL